MNSKNGEEKFKEIISTRFNHPFNAFITGPSQSGKSTFVRDLLINHKDYVNTSFQYIYLFLGTSPEENPPLNELLTHFQKTHIEVKIFNILKLFDTPKKLEVQALPYIKRLVRSKKNQPGCIVFDDLMMEMGDMNIIPKFFTKYSSHWNVSVIFITQNAFSQGKKSQNMTLYRNTHVLVVFKSILDNSGLSIVASRMMPGSKPFKKMLKQIQHDYRYVVLRGDFKTDERLRVTSDYFSKYPVPHFKAFELKESEIN